MRKEIIIFLTIFEVLFAAGCAGYGDSEEAAPVALEEEKTEEFEPEDEAGHDEKTGMEEEETETEIKTDGGNGEETETQRPAENEEPATAAGEEITDIEIRNFTYIPDILTVEIGQTVRWTNHDSVMHNVIGERIESDTLNEGDTFTFTFKDEGTYDYICTFHPGMKGTVIVEA